jgi:hypothetical protein
MPRTIKGVSRWRSDELEKLRQLAATRTNAQLAEMLGRNENSIALQISHLQLRGKGHRGRRAKVILTPQETRDHVRRMMQLSARVEQLKKWKEKAA